MKHTLLITTLCVGVLASSAATAEAFQHQTGLSLSDNNSYSISLSPFYAYYFNPVDDSHGPLEMAGFLNQTSSVSIRFKQTDYPSSSQYTKNYDWRFYGDFVFDNGLNIGLGLNKSYTNYSAASSIALDVSTPRIDVGYYLDQYRYFNFGLSQMESSEDQKMDTFSVSGIYMVPLEEGEFIKFNADFEINDHIRSYWDSKAIDLEMTYYPQHDLGFSAGFAHELFDEQNNSSTYSFGSKYFFNPSVYASLDMSMTMQGSENWSNKQTLQIGSRF